MEAAPRAATPSGGAARTTMVSSASCRVVLFFRICAGGEKRG